MLTEAPTIPSNHPTTPPPWPATTTRPRPPKPTRYAPPSPRVPQRSRAAQRLKAALWYSIGQIVDDESLRTNTNATPQYIGALTELAWSQLGIAIFRARVEADCGAESVAKDLEAFAKHAGRSQINSEDVMLLTRRNEGLEAVLRSYLENQRSSREGDAPRGGRKK